MDVKWFEIFLENLSFKHLSVNDFHIYTCMMEAYTDAEAAAVANILKRKWDAFSLNFRI